MHGHVPICYSYNVHIPVLLFYDTFSHVFCEEDPRKWHTRIEMSPVQGTAEISSQLAQVPSTAMVWPREKSTWTLLFDMIEYTWWFQHEFNNNSQFAGVDMCNHQEYHLFSYFISSLMMCIQQFWSFWSSVRGAKARSVSLFPYLGIEAPSETCPCFNMFATHKQLSFSDWFGGKDVQPTSRWTQRMDRLCWGMAVGSESAQLSTSLFFFQLKS